MYVCMYMHTTIAEKKKILLGSVRRKKACQIGEKYQVYPRPRKNPNAQKSKKIQRLSNHTSLQTTVKCPTP